MLDSLQASILRLLGREVDPLGSISPEQLKAVLKSIEGKYNSLRDENKRLKGVIDEHLETIERLKLDLKEARESMTPHGHETFRVQRDELSAQLEELQRIRAMERSEWDAKLADLEHKLIDAQRQRMGDDEQRQDLELRHQIELNQQRDALEGRYLTERTRLLEEQAKLREEIDRLEAQVSRQVSDTEIRDRLDSEKHTLRARVEELTAERDQLEAKLREAESRQAERRPTETRPVVRSGPAVSPQAPPQSSPPAETPDRRELLARLLGGG